MQESSAEGTLECHSAHWTDRRPSDMIIYIEIDRCCLSTVMQVTCATTALEGSCPLSKTVIPIVVTLVSKERQSL